MCIFQDCLSADDGHGPALQLVLHYELRPTADGRIEPSLGLLPRIAKAGASLALVRPVRHTGALLT